MVKFTLLLSVTVLMATSGFANRAVAMPEELRSGMMTYALAKEDFLGALLIPPSTESEIKTLRALQGYGLNDQAQILLDNFPEPLDTLSKEDLFLLGKAHYANQDCIKALQFFKAVQRGLSDTLRQEWMYYSSQCFIALDAPSKSVQILNQILDGRWAAYGYFNLAMKYFERNKSRSKALNALKAARELNPALTPEERELLNRINYAAGIILFEADKAEAAKTLFNDIYLDSDSAPQALYMNGLVHLELNDFRGATQLWNKAKPYPLIHPGVAEAALAVPYAFERAGYTRQAMEAYVDASRLFEDELKALDKVKESISQKGFQEAIVKATFSENVEWFLAKGVSKNTARAAYFSFLMRNALMFELANHYQDLDTLISMLENWAYKLESYRRALADKRGRARSKWNLEKPRAELNQAQSIVQGIERTLSDRETVSTAATRAYEQSKSMLEFMSSRLANLENAQRASVEKLDEQLSMVRSYADKVDAQTRKLKTTMKILDAEMSEKATQLIDSLRESLELQRERSEQGLVNIFEQVAIEKQSKVNPLDRRYQ